MSQIHNLNRNRVPISLFQVLSVKPFCTGRIKKKRRKKKHSVKEEIAADSRKNTIDLDLLESRFLDLQISIFV